jgi:hypothetical protein
VSALRPTYLSTAEGVDALAPMPWPDGDERVPFPINHVQSATTRFAGKFFLAGDVRKARLGDAGEWVELSWSGVAKAGVWMTYGAWPSPNDIIHVAIEPTTSADDTLAEAISRGRAVSLPPGRSTAWSVTVSLRRL